MLTSTPLQTLAPSVAWPITICVISYGSHAQLAGRFLDSLYENTNSSLFTLRAGLNEAEEATRRLFHQYSATFRNIELFTEEQNIFKCPLMRRIFHERSIHSKWVVWCDDDTYFTRPDWLQRLALKIESSPATDMWGWIHTICLFEQSTLDWIRRSNWFQDIPFLAGRDRKGRVGAEIRFATGAFWALRTKLIYELNWPDPRLKQGADDFILGEALRQNGRRIENFHHGVTINDARRRNLAAPEHSHILH